MWIIVPPQVGLCEQEWKKYTHKVPKNCIYPTPIPIFSAAAERVVSGFIYLRWNFWVHRPTQNNFWTEFLPQSHNLGVGRWAKKKKIAQPLPTIWGSCGWLVQSGARRVPQPNKGQWIPKLDGNSEARIRNKNPKKFLSNEWPRNRCGTNSPGPRK